MNKLRVIDLLNKIANGEEVKAKHNLFDLEYYNKNEMQIGYGEGINMFTLMDLIRVINDEVEVIENKKIRKICTFPGLDDDDYAYEDGNRPNNVKINNKMEELLIDKINEIVDYINGGTNGE